MSSGHPFEPDFLQDGLAAASSASTNSIISGHRILRARTAGNHAVVDRMFSRFDLADPKSYMLFLQSHARVVIPIEIELAEEPTLPPWRPRASVLAQDLAAVGCDLSDQLSIGRTLGAAEKFGLLYVLEGSRLGGQILKRRVGLKFSCRYLSDAHYPGEWPAFIHELDARAAGEGSGWLEEVIVGATLGFQLFAKSVDYA